MRNAWKSHFREIAIIFIRCAVLISAADQYQGTMAFSTGAAHPTDMDHRQVEFSSAIFDDPRVLGGRREQSHLGTPAASYAARNL